MFSAFNISLNNAFILLFEKCCIILKLCISYVSLPDSILGRVLSRTVLSSEIEILLKFFILKLIRCLWGREAIPIIDSWPPLPFNGSGLGNSWHRIIPQTFWLSVFIFAASEWAISCISHSLVYRNRSYRQVYLRTNWLHRVVAIVTSWGGNCCRSRRE